MTAYDVFRYMKAYCVTSRIIPSTDELKAYFKDMSIQEIMKGERMFNDWMGDVSA